MKRVTAGLLFGLLIGCSDSPNVEVDSSTAAVPIELAKPTPEAKSTDSTIDAQELLSSTLELAKKENKRVLVHLGAPWCGWCKVLDEFLHANSALFADDYIDLKIDVEQMKHGAEVAKKLRGDRTGGIPWIVILDSNGAELVSSDGPNGNIGCPMAEEEQAYFITMLEKTRQHAHPDRVVEIAKALTQFAQQKKKQR